MKVAAAIVVAGRGVDLQPANHGGRSKGRLSNSPCIGIDNPRSTFDNPIMIKVAMIGVGSVSFALGATNVTGPRHEV